MLRLSLCPASGPAGERRSDGRGYLAFSGGEGTPAPLCPRRRKRHWLENLPAAPVGRGPGGFLLSGQRPRAPVRAGTLDPPLAGGIVSHPAPPLPSPALPSPAPGRAPPSSSIWPRGFLRQVPGDLSVHEFTGTPCSMTASLPVLLSQSPELAARPCEGELRARVLASSVARVPLRLQSSLVARMLSSLTTAVTVTRLMTARGKSLSPWLSCHLQRATVQRRCPGRSAHRCVSAVHVRGSGSTHSQSVKVLQKLSEMGRHPGCPFVK